MSAGIIARAIVSSRSTCPKFVFRALRRRARSHLSFEWRRHQTFDTRAAPLEGDKSVESLSLAPSLSNLRLQVTQTAPGKQRKRANETIPIFAESNLRERVGERERERKRERGKKFFLSLTGEQQQQ